MNLPKNAKKVFSGTRYDTYQWEQEMYDGTKTIFEAIKRNPSVQIIPIIGDKILLAKEEQPFRGKFTGMIGGECDAREKPEESAKRELIEETGMESENLILWKKTSFGIQINWDTYYYIAKNCKKIQEPNPGNGEKIEILEITFDELFNEVEKEEFRNKSFKEILFRIKHTPGEKEKLKKQLFE
ncbi:NUDIX domain-containing protein [Candidatus Woesearchaeota archaeon]|nr:NUDIX domain-containing protein [Candidatus Woesearchaeota archaeon]MCF7900628.1 NUDIX domain-containing protein [Candidatus Woesearchaeota archaeon]MCF8013468.1 NUDIX domain-containing protein [Candidatus Woesearchaeota archaeon]